IRFGILSPEEILEVSKVNVCNKDLFSSGNVPNVGGLLDYRMGTSDRFAPCQTCFADNRECPGHFGHMKLAKPVYNYGFMDYILDTLHCVCPHCSRLLVSRRDKKWKTIYTMSN